ncbi:MAG: hypothetical protein QXY87_07150 [Saccharolobus sp.]|uniref:tRNA-guanine(15) transglycosylase-like protein n=2 Tax=Saccharolobus shibatae TaxID=2286 RepID=A0A8F5BMR1_SACSH|nr:hypothetical protein [Saccharolobus shibatae]MCH4815474.1 hypothetical protein [Saccharolobus shibatae]QXJ28144.1 tRNA-guanine(15) transglycosylase-like protein [Saccharolobus shibatae B12]QXJ31469.1 tRNA-guanine(15) transglycosylase-like protein [Saccharolobus shibatae]
MKIILGIPDLKIPVWTFKQPLMVNQLNWNNLSWENETWVDSGGYQIMVKGIKVEIEKVVEKYKILDATQYMSLDIPSNPCHKPSELNYKYFEYLYGVFDKKIVPVIHAYDVESIKKSIDFYSKYTDLVAFGGIIPPTLNKSGNKKLAVTIYHLVRKLWKGKIHVLGAGSPFMRKVYFNANSVDTSTYRIKGIHGMVIIPGKGERYVGERKIVWGTRRASEEELENLLSFLDRTNYPFPIRLDNWVDRSLINAWVLLNSEYEINNPLIEYSKKLDSFPEDEIEEEVNELCMRATI